MREHPAKPEIAIPAKAWALLDKAGVIVAVSASWQQMAGCQSPPVRAGIGETYLDFCAAPPARHVRDNLIALLEGRTERFALVYDCGEETNFVPVALLASKVMVGDQPHFLLRHLNLALLDTQVAETILQVQADVGALKAAFDTDAASVCDAPRDARPVGVKRALEQLGVALDAVRLAHDEAQQLSAIAESEVSNLLVRLAAAIDKVDRLVERRLLH